MLRISQDKPPYWVNFAKWQGRLSGFSLSFFVIDGFLVQVVKGSEFRLLRV
jgi:hypothetical protein